MVPDTEQERFPRSQVCVCVCVCVYVCVCVCSVKRTRLSCRQQRAYVLDNEKTITKDYHKRKNEILLLQNVHGF